MPNRSVDQTSDQSHSVSHGISLSSLRRKRGNVIGQITAFSKFLETQKLVEQRNVPLLKIHLKGMNDTWKRFDDVQLQLEELDDSETPRRYEIQAQYYAVITQAEIIIDQERPIINTRRTTLESTTPTVTAPMAIKLPEMRLPTFDGTIEKWTSYFDIFCSMIDRNDDFTPVQKLQYLRSTLTGKAAACIQSLSITDVNYADALELLKDKYNCTRRILLSHCDGIRQIPRLTKDTPGALGHLVDTMNQHLRALKNLSENIASWNSILISIILSKISAYIAWHWELTLRDKKMLEYTNLLEFLEKRANCAPAAVSKPLPSTSGKSNVYRNTRSAALRGHALVSVQAPQCHICKGNHETRYCATLKVQPVHERIKTVELARLCNNCLGKKHPIRSCPSGSCHVCNKKHHTLLHRSWPTQQFQNSTSPSPPRSNPQTIADPPSRYQPSTSE
ncbi:hypothetical protein ANTQUA_LOCUS703 [Anthophora quadrimaculata]